MGRPKRAAAAPSAPKPKPFDGFKLALSGKFNSIGYSQSQLETVVKDLGGSVGPRVDGSTTHLVCTQDDFDKQTTKVVAAQDKDVPIVNSDWLLECSEKEQLLSVDNYVFSAQQKNGTVSNNAQSASAPAPGPSSTKTTVPSRGKKRKADDEGGDSKDDSQQKKKAANGGDMNGEEEVKEVAEGQYIKKRDFAIPVDEHCPHSNRVVYIDPDSGMIYDASLNQSNSSHNNNKFYRVQIVYDAQKKAYDTWTRWGRVGEIGQSALLGDGTLPAAIKHFEKKFRDKSGLPWDKRGDDPKPGKYAFVERNYNPDSDDEDEDDDDADHKKAIKKEGDGEDDEPAVKCTLEQPVQDLMALIFNQQYFQVTMASLNFDSNKMPLGKLSKATITRGFQQLKDLAALIDDPSLASSKWNMPIGAAKEHLSNTYYSIIPHAFGRNRPPIISENSLLKKEIELLESLLDMKDAADIMKLERKPKGSVDPVHHLDRQFQGLGLSEMTTLDPKSTEFDLLAQYLQGSRGATHHVKYDIDHIWRIERDGEKARFDQSEYAKVKSDRRLLWHGSRCTNYGGILSQGLRIAPPEAPVSGYMFGKGIYLADMSSKSANYCAHYNSNGHALLLLCEAELGDPMQKLVHASYTAGETAKNNNMYSTWGQGSTGPSKWMDAGDVHSSLKGVKLPDTKTVPGATNVSGAGLLYNEYICYDVAQVRLRYLFRVKMH